MASEISGQLGRPTVWKMVKEAVEALGGKTTNVAVRDWILKKYPGTNVGTINCQIIVCTVNSSARLNWPCNQKPRKADGKYDVLFAPEAGAIELYAPEKHGQWEIRPLPDGKLTVAQVGQPPAQPSGPADPSDASGAELQGTQKEKRAAPLGESSEKAWVVALAPRLERALQAVSLRNAKVRVVCHRRIPYAHEVLAYQGSEPASVHFHPYETDLLICDESEGDRWVPRVIIECKVESVTTHDALTYSAKAATHKQVHPYLRYGILIGSWGDTAFPGRLFRHGAYFDFMATWDRYEPTDEEWHALVETLISEVKASRKIQQMLTKQRVPGSSRLKMIHRPVSFR